MEGPVNQTLLSAPRLIRIEVKGMACWACAHHVKKTLNKIPGVQASVSFSTKLATVDARSDVTVAELCHAVEQAGYQARERSDADGADPDLVGLSGGERDVTIRDRLAAWWRRLSGSQG